MALLENYLRVKRSGIPNAGKGLFTTCAIKKQTLIVEYKGLVTSWKTIQQAKNFNAYVYYINRNLVIDAKPYKKYFARYANDANGILKLKDIKNNCAYTIIDKKVFIKATKNLAAGEEIFVSYGKEYWDVVKYNMQIKKT